MMHVFIRFRDNQNQVKEFEGTLAPDDEMGIIIQRVIEQGFSYLNDDKQLIFISPSQIIQLRYRNNGKEYSIHITGD